MGDVYFFKFDYKEFLFEVVGVVMLFDWDMDLLCGFYVVSYLSDYINVEFSFSVIGKLEEFGMEGCSYVCFEFDLYLLESYLYLNVENIN